MIHLDFSGEDYTDVKVLKQKLDAYLGKHEESLGLEKKDITFSERLRNIISKLHEESGSQVVVLVDEYDNPITSAIGDAGLQERFRAILYGFYSSLKSLDEHLHFCLLTGVTKYGHLSIFSGLNNLFDISLMNEFAGICGITEDELHSALEQGVRTLAEEEGCGINEAYGLLKDWYDGYHFSKSMLDVYNPFSVMNALTRKEVSDFWYQTGTSTILIMLMQKHSIDISNLHYS